MLDTVTDNPRAVPGDNNPPEPTPFEKCKTRAEGIYIETKNWLGKAVETAEEASAVARLIELAQAEKNATDKVRKELVKPHDDAKAEIQDQFNTLIGDNKAGKGILIRALDGLRAALKPYQDEQERKLAEERESKRREAEEARLRAEEAQRSASLYDIDAREEAEALNRQAKQAEKDARQAEKTKPQVMGGSRAIGLRKVYRAELVKPSAFMRFLWETEGYQQDVLAFLQNTAQRLVSGGLRDLPGVEVVEDSKVQ